MVTTSMGMRASSVEKDRAEARMRQRLRTKLCRTWVRKYAQCSSRVRSASDRGGSPSAAGLGAPQNSRQPGETIDGHVPRHANKAE